MGRGLGLQARGGSPTFRCAPTGSLLGISSLSLSLFFFILNDFIFKRYIDIYTCTEDVFHVHGLGSYLRASAHWEIIFYKNKAENNTAQFRT